MKKNFQMFIMGSIVTMLLILSNLVFELYPSLKYAVIAFDSLLLIALLIFAIREIKQMIQETSVKYVACTLVASLVVLYLVVRLVT